MGGNSVNEKIIMKQYPLPQSTEPQLIDFTSKPPGKFGSFNVGINFVVSCENFLVPVRITLVN